jgi:hypothetical protein
MQTRRDYAASLGLAKAGARGKFSNEAKAAIAKAEAEGVKFSDSTGNPVKPVAGGQKEESAPVKTDPRDSLYCSPSDFRFPEEEYRAIASIGGKRVVHSMRECCNLCGVSLTNHACNTPSVHGIPVVIERR